MVSVWITLGCLGMLLLFQWGFNNRQMLTQERRLREKDRDFRNGFVSQSTVDARLTHWATEFDRVCQIQIKEQSLNDASIGAFVRGVEDTKRTIDAYKAIFWDAHRLATDFGYNVRNSYKDYLPKPVAYGLDEANNKISG